MPSMNRSLDALMAPIIGLIAVVARYARRTALAMGAAAIVVVAVLRSEPPAGFGWSFPGWWLPALVVFAPSAILFVFALSAGRMAKVVREWPAQFGAAAEGALDSVMGAAEAAVATTQRRRSFVGLARGVWELRTLVGRVRNLLGRAAPAALTLSPGYLLLTVLAVAAGTAVMFAAGGLVLLRVLL